MRMLIVSMGWMALGGCYLETRPVARPVAVVQAQPAVAEPQMELHPAPAELQVQAEASTGGSATIASTGGGTHPPIVCHGSEDIVLDGVTIEGDVAVQASGSCNVVLTNCTLRGAQAAVVASGSADVQLQACNVAAPVAVDARGSADVAIAGSNVQGEVRATGSADVVRM